MLGLSRYLMITNQEDHIKQNAKGFVQSIQVFLKELLDIRTNTDMQATRDSIIADIPFKGHTSWILISSIFIASIGLNANSTAVVIGAMLISPLMGPILGLGFSLATNDIDLLNRSLKNFLVMVGLSVVTAYLFFALFPLRDESSELLARVRPDIRDVLIGFFGGVALVVARAKKGTIASVIFGVAIATALMPPLCTVGFSLAISNWSYALGALYLFLINTIFIALATFVVIKYLKFPMERYANSSRRRLISRIAYILSIVVMIPAAYTFYGVLQESLFKRDAQQFLKETIELYPFEGNGVYRRDFSTLNFNRGQAPEISVMVLGDEVIPQEVINTWKVKQQQYERLQDASFQVLQGNQEDSEAQFNYVMELYESKKSELVSKDRQIQLLEQELARLSRSGSLQLPFEQIKSELVLTFPELINLSYGAKIQTDFARQDTLQVFEVEWLGELAPSRKTELSTRLEAWLKTRLQQKNVVLEVKD